MVEEGGVVRQCRRFEEALKRMSTTNVYLGNSPISTSCKTLGNTCGCDISAPVTPDGRFNPDSNRSRGHYVLFFDYGEPGTEPKIINMAYGTNSPYWGVVTAYHDYLEGIWGEDRPYKVTDDRLTDIAITATSVVRLHDYIRRTEQGGGGGGEETIPAEFKRSGVDILDVRDTLTKFNKVHNELTELRYDPEKSVSYVRPIARAIARDEIEQYIHR